MIVADTHALVWRFLNSRELSPAARIAFASNPIGVSAVTCFEVARLVERHRIDLRIDVRDWLASIFALPEIVLLPLTIEIAVSAAQVPGPVTDPIDRIIVATALQQGAALVTKDQKITASRLVQTIW